MYFRTDRNKNSNDSANNRYTRKRRSYNSSDYRLGTSSVKRADSSSSAYTSTADVKHSRRVSPSTALSTTSRQSEYSRSRAQAEYVARRKRRTRKKNVIIGILVALFSIVFVAAAGAMVYVNSINSQLQSGLDTDLSNVLVEQDAPQDPFYVLLMGTDGRTGEESYRSDTIILARVDPQTEQVTLVSIPRDTRVYMDGHGYQKINAAYAYGGAELAISTVSEFAGVDISHYLEVDFSGFSEIVDALDGITVDVPADTELDGVVVPEGVQVLDGDQALIFVRCRKTYALGDYQRAENQRAFIKAVAEKLLASDAATMTSTITTLLQYVTTDMSVSDILSIATSMRGIDVETSIYSAVVPSDTGTIDGVSYVLPDEEAWAEMMSRVDAGLSPIAEETSTDTATDTTAETATETTTSTETVSQ